MITAVTDGVLRFLGHTVVDATALALITGALALTVLRRARPALIAWLWLVVLLKFAIPIAPSFPLSLSGLLDRVFDGVASAPASAIAAASPATTLDTAVPAGPAASWQLL